MRWRMACLTCLWILAAALAGCAMVMGPKSVTWSEADLNRMLERRFPMDRRLLEVLDVKVSQPFVRLLPESNRLAATVSVDAVDRLFATRYHGRLAMETALHYDDTDNSLHLVDVRVTDFSLGSAESTPRLPVQRLGAVVAQTLLEGTAIHHLTPEQLERLSQHGYKPGGLKVTERGLELTVVPVP